MGQHFETFNPQNLRHPAKQSVLAGSHILWQQTNHQQTTNLPNQG
jgi:hypothetical protein